jgi:hypothetical protein
VRFELANVIFASTPVPYHADWSTREHGQWTEKKAFTSVLLSENSDKSSALIPDFLQIRQTCWCLCLTDVRHKTLQLMEGIDKPHLGKYKEITNDSNYDANCTLTSLPVWDLENFKRLIFVVQSVHVPGLIFLVKALILYHYLAIRRHDK